MTRKDLFERVKKKAYDKADQNSFNAAYPSFDVYEQKNYSSHDKVVKLIEKLKKSNVISTDCTLEQFYKYFVCDL